jgi:tetratricopeptide (TPR) repeat protein
VTRVRIGNWQVILYHIPVSPGRSSDMRAEWVQSGTWIDLHLSVMMSRNESDAEGEKILRDALSSIQVSERQPAMAAKYMSEGSALYLRNDFKNAIRPYSKALELEKEQPTLDKNMWHVLVDNLGMAYGITGDLKKAKETFEYGLTKDSAYPLFYYNLACLYAEMNDLESAIKQLKRAFEYRQNVLPGETMPDPSKDDSFQRFMRNPQFLAALDEIKKSKIN